MVRWKKILLPICAAVATVALAVGLGSAYADDELLATTSTPEVATEATYPAVPIYRLYNPSSGEHLYTSDANECAVLGSGGSWNDEGIGWYAPRDAGTPVYRLFDPISGDHLYTTDLNEKSVLASRGWQIDNANTPLFLSEGTRPILRLFSTSSGRHLITKDTNEYRVLEQLGWQPEGIKLYGTDASSADASWPLGESTIATEASESAVEASISLSGTGSGSTAKLVASAEDASVSFGLRTNGDASQASTEFLIENDLDGSDPEVKLVPCGFGEQGSTYRLLMTIQPTGVVDVYVNGTRVKSVRNPGLAESEVELRLEAAGKSVGDEVQAIFSDVKLKDQGRYVGDEAHGWKAQTANDACGIKANTSAFPVSVSFDGTVSVLSEDGPVQSMRGVGSVTMVAR